MITENGPFGTGSQLASLSSEDKVRWFLAQARRQRQFVLEENTPPADVLAHLNLLDAGQPTHAAVLLFGKQPQRFLITSEVMPRYPATRCWPIRCS